MNCGHLKCTRYVTATDQEKNVWNWTESFVKPHRVIYILMTHLSKHMFSKLITQQIQFVNSLKRCVQSAACPYHISTGHVCQSLLWISLACVATYIRNTYAVFYLFHTSRPHTEINERLPGFNLFGRLRSDYVKSIFDW